MKTFQFEPNKNGFELSIDLLTFKKTPKYHFASEAHQTDYFEIVFFKKAKGHLLLDEQRINLQDFTVVFISPFQKRKWFVKKKNMLCSSLIFHQDFLNDFFSDKFFVYRLQYFFNRIQKPSLYLDEESFSSSISSLQDINKELKGYQSDSSNFIQSLLFSMLIKLNRAYAKEHQLSNDTQGNEYAYKFKLLLEASIRMKHLVDEYAEMLDVSRITLNKVAKEQFGVTASEMIRERLLLEVKDELRHTEKTVSEIARSLHFSEPNHMMRFFKNYTKLTPTEYRNQDVAK